MTTQYAGLTAMVRATDMPADKTAAKGYVRALAEQMEMACRTHVGHVAPKGAPMFTMDGPVDDPSTSSISLQGKPELVYVFTYAVPIETDDLPNDCTAYAAMVRP